MALAELRWPLDPALAATRDETTIARAVYATPLRTDAGGRVAPGLCTGWSASSSFRVWRFTGCRAAPAIAAELRRVARMDASPARWIFAAARAIASPAPNTVLVRLRFPWRRFPYALTTVAAAPRHVAGSFRVVHASAARLVLRAAGKTLVFRRLSGLAAVRAFRRGAVDEAPVPLGDIGRFSADVELHVRTLLAQDLVTFRSGAVAAEVRRAYWDTANRADYQALVAENRASAALGIAGVEPKPDPAAFRRAIHRIPSLPAVEVRITVPDDPVLRYGANLLYGQWREAGLGPKLVSGKSSADADLRRVLAVYPQDEALLGALGLPTPLGAADQRSAFDRIDEQLRTAATVVPVCWVVDARLVSPALRGWREDLLGDVDYASVTLR